MADPLGELVAVHRADPILLGTRIGCVAFSVLVAAVAALAPWLAAGAWSSGGAVLAGVIALLFLSLAWSGIAHWRRDAGRGVEVRAHGLRVRDEAVEEVRWDAVRRIRLEVDASYTTRWSVLSMMTADGIFVRLPARLWDRWGLGARVRDALESRLEAPEAQYDAGVVLLVEVPVAPPVASKYR